MKSLEVPLYGSKMHGQYGFSYDHLMCHVARHRLPALVPPHSMYAEEKAAWAEAIGVDELEEVFLLRHLSVDLQTGKAFMFYEDNYAWCIEHQMYVSEDRHKGLDHG